MDETARQRTDLIGAIVAASGANSVLLLAWEESSTTDELTNTIGERLNVLALGAGGLAQASCQHDVVVVDLTGVADAGLRRAATHTAIQHVRPRGAVVVIHDDELALGSALAAADFVVDGAVVVGDRQVSTCRRGSRTTVHDLVFEARSMIGRVRPCELCEQLRSDRPPLVVDTRTDTDRLRFGVIEQSIHVPLSVVEWHLDPANAYLHPAVESFDQPVVVICNGGYSSSLAAANLVRIGFTNVADLIGGFHAWSADGLPVAAPDHSHLDW